MTYKDLFGNYLRTVKEICITAPFIRQPYQIRLKSQKSERISPFWVGGYPPFSALNDYFGTQYASIYDITEIGDVEEFRRKIKTHPILKNLDMIRQACINYYKALHGGYIVCECCGFDLTKAYDIDDEYIEIHHRFPFSQTEGEHPVNSQTDLVPLCANCHRMIHHGQGGKGNCMSLEELKRKYKGIRYKNE